METATRLFCCGVRRGGLILHSEIKTKKTDVARLDAHNVYAALGGYFRRHGSLPADETWGEVLVREGLLREMPRDPWGRTFIYIIRGERVEIHSLGADGMPGGEALNKDLVYSFPVPSERGGDYRE